MIMPAGITSLQAFYYKAACTTGNAYIHGEYPIMYISDIIEKQTGGPSSVGNFKDV